MGMVAIVVPILYLMVPYLLDERKKQKVVEKSPLLDLSEIENKEREMIEAELAISAERKKPKCRVQFVIRGEGTQYSAVQEPEIQRHAYGGFHIYTSENLAKSLLSSFWSNGVFEDKNGWTYPSSGVLQARVVEVKNEKENK